MKTKLCRIDYEIPNGYSIRWGYDGKREDCVPVCPTTIGRVFESDRGYLVVEGSCGDYDVVSIWKTKEAALRRLRERHEEAWCKTLEMI